MPWTNPVEHFRNFFLPALALALPLGAVFTRLLRSDMILTLQSDFITLASAKGVSPNRVLWVHALRNSSFSLLTSVGVQSRRRRSAEPWSSSSSSTSTAWASLLVTSIQSKDLFVVQAITAIVVAIVVVVNLIVDLLYAVIDPRIRQMRALA